MPTTYKDLIHDIPLCIDALEEIRHAQHEKLEIAAKIRIQSIRRLVLLTSSEEQIDTDENKRHLHRRISRHRVVKKHSSSQIHALQKEIRAIRFQVLLLVKYLHFQDLEKLELYFIDTPVRGVKKSLLTKPFLREFLLRGFPDDKLEATPVRTALSRIQNHVKKTLPKETSLSPTVNAELPAEITKIAFGAEELFEKPKLPSFFEYQTLLDEFEMTFELRTLGNQIGIDAQTAKQLVTYFSDITILRHTHHKSDFEIVSWLQGARDITLDTKKVDAAEKYIKIFLSKHQDRSKASGTSV